MTATNTDPTTVDEPTCPAADGGAEGCSEDVFDATLRGTLGWLLSRAAHGYGHAMEAALSELDLSLREWFVLLLLRGERASQQQALGRSAGIDKTTLVSTVDQLERRGFVRRRPDERDRRVRIVELTDAGGEMVEGVEAVVRDVDAAVLGGLDPSERDVLFSALRHLVDVTESVAAARGSCV